MKKILPFLFVFLTFFLSVSETNAQVVINEFLPNSSQEWVEFYNPGASRIDLSEYVFDDDVDFNSDSGSSVKVELLGLIDPQSACFWEFSSYLNNGNDSPTLFRSDATIIDSYTYTQSAPEKSFSRIPDGGEWQVDQSPTKSTQRCLDSAPTPTPSPTLSPTPSPIPTKTPTPKPTLSPTKTPYPKTSPKSFTTRAVEEGNNNENREVLGVGNAATTPTATGLIQEEGEREFPLVAVLFIAVGLALIGFASMIFFKAKKKEYNEVNGENS